MYLRNASHHQTRVLYLTESGEIREALSEGKLPNGGQFLAKDQQTGEKRLLTTDEVEIID